LRVLWLGVAAIVTPALAQERVGGIVRFSRADVAEAYLALERAHRAHPPGENAAEINRAFDDATIRFFAGRNVVEALRVTTNRLRFGEDITPNQAYASSLRVSARPAVLNLAKPEAVTLNVEQMYDAPAVGAVTVKILSPTGRVVFEAPVTGPRADLPVEAAKCRVGTYRVQIESSGDVQFTTRWVVTERALSEIREELLKEVATVEGLEQAVAAFRARARLLSDTPSAEETAQFQSDPIQLREELEREAADIRAGKDPYSGRKGDHWRVFSYRGAEIPCRVFAPAGAIGKASPLVIALHGAGGDENIWMDGYGAGELKHQAEKHGFVVVSPRTEMLIGNAPVFDALVEAVGELYPVSRVYLIGHSMGAMASTGLSAQRPDKVAAACLIAGTGQFASSSRRPPTLVISGDLDPLMRADHVRAGVAAAKKAGQPVELWMLEGRGHTLLVGEQMPAAIAWLLRHK
jgi:poly(3-hydroxybutyrate) depolymerase